MPAKMVVVSDAAGSACIGGIILTVSNHAEIAYQPDEQLQAFLHPGPDDDARGWMMADLPSLERTLREVLERE